MSPEQAEGEERVDARIDVWAAAVVLYEMIAGHEPWDAANCPALLRAIAHDDPPSIKGRGGVDAPLWSILELGLAKKRDDRLELVSRLRVGARLVARRALDRRRRLGYFARERVARRTSSSGADDRRALEARFLDAMPPAATSARHAAQTLRVTRLRILSAAAVVAFLFFLGFRNRQTAATVVVAPAASALTPPMETAVPSAPPSTAPSVPADAVPPPAPVTSPPSRRRERPAVRAKPVASSAPVAAPVVRAPPPSPSTPRSAQSM